MLISIYRFFTRSACGLLKQIKRFYRNVLFDFFLYVCRNLNGEKVSFDVIGREFSRRIFRCRVTSNRDYSQQWSLLHSAETSRNSTISPQKKTTTYKLIDLYYYLWIAIWNTNRIDEFVRLRLLSCLFIQESDVNIQ